MRCERCNADNRDGRRFCAQCGAPLTYACAACGFANEPGEKFCGGCGAALTRLPDTAAHRAPGHADGAAAQAAHPPAERRQLTVMFCDLVGSTALSRRLDPEDLRAVIRAYQSTCGSIISRYEGFIGRFVGDGILAHFGYPTAHEDDAERAVRAALEIAEAVPRLKPQIGVRGPIELAVRVGIATGLVIAGDLIGEGAAEEQAVIGETPNLAARLQGLAHPNTVVISPATHDLIVAGFECEDLGPFELKGFAEAVHPWRVLRPRVAGSRFEVTRSGGLSPLVGRERELDLLARLWERAGTGSGQVVLLSGEAGIGKSRLIQALREHIAGTPCTVVRYQCSPYHTNSALYPFMEQISRAAGIERDDGAAQKLDKLEALLGQAASDVAEIAPLFAGLLSIPNDGRYPERELNPQQDKERTLEALVEQMAGLAARAPLLAILEDAHWIDPTSEELFHLAVQRAADIRVLVVISFRQDFAPPWTGPAHVTPLALRRLGRRALETLARGVAGEHALAPDLLAQIADKTDGVPLFVEELTRTVLNVSARTEEGEPLPVLEIPATLQDSLRARLDALGPAKHVAQIGAVAGREFQRRLVAAVAEVDERALDAALDELVCAHLVVRGRGGDEPSYVFKHALVQDAAYESLLRSTRQTLHGRLAEALESLYPEYVETQPELLAHHYTEAGRAEAALAYWAQAGRRGLGRSADREVIGHAHHGLEVLERVPASRERDRAELGFRILQGAAYRTVRGFGSKEVERSFARALDLCDQLGARAELVEVLRGLYGCYYVRGELSKAREHGERVIELGEHSGDPDCVMLGRYMVGCVKYWQGQFREARQELEQAIALYDPRAHRSVTLSAQTDPRANAMLHLGWTLWVCGFPEQAIATGEEAIAVARELSQPLTLAMALFTTCFSHLGSGNYDEAERLTAELRALTHEHGIAYLSACATVLEAQDLLARDRFEEGFRRMERALEEFRAQGAGVGIPWAQSVAIAALGRAGRAAEGLALASQALAAVERHGERHWEAELHRLKGELILALPDGSRPDAERCLRRALSLARRQEAGSLELRAAMSLARMLSRDGQDDAAREVLAPVFHRFTEGFETADLREAERLLARLHASARSG